MRRQNGFDRGLIRATDALAAGAAVVLLAPLWGLISLAIWAQAGRPILTTETTHAGGRAVRCLRFRTAAGDGAFWAGSFLEKSRLAGLPRLLNVLSGDLSLVEEAPAAGQARRSPTLPYGGRTYGAYLAALALAAGTLLFDQD